jgi:bifunctional non-homologous end joining protein LigD
MTASWLGQARRGIPATPRRAAKPSTEIFAHARRFGAEGIVSKRRESPYRSGRTRTWLKVKNPKSPAVMRIEDGDLVMDEPQRRTCWGKPPGPGDPFR